MMNFATMNSATKKIKKDTVIKYLFILSFLIVQIIHFFVFYVAVNVNSVLLAFKTPNGEGIFYNFKHFFHLASTNVPVFSEYLPNTLKFFFADWLLLIIGLTFAYFIYKQIRGGRFFRVMFFLPGIICSTVMVMIYKKMIAIDGPIVALMMLFNKNAQPPEILSNSDYALNAILVYTLWSGFGSKILLLGGAMVRIPSDVIEYGKLEGIKPFREMVTIIVPMIWPTISTMITLMMTGLFTSSGPILLFTEGSYGTTTISYWIFTMVYGASSGMYPLASAVGLFFTVIGLPIVLGVKYLMNKIDADVSY